MTLFYSKVHFEMKALGKLLQLWCARSHGVMVSTLDFESSDPSSNLGGTWREYICYSIVRVHFGTPKHGTFLLFLFIHLSQCRILTNTKPVS